MQLLLILLIGACAIGLTVAIGTVNWFLGFLAMVPIYKVADRLMRWSLRQ